MPVADYWNRGAQTGGQRPNTQFQWTSPLQSIFQDLKTQSVVGKPLPGVGSTFLDNAPSNNPPMIAPKMPEMGTSYTPATNVPMIAPKMPEMGTSYTPPPSPVPDNNIPYATFENLGAYFNPFYQFLMDEGTRQIQGSAAAKGRLQSSKTINEIGSWSNEAGARAFEGALNSFFRDRGDMYGMMKDSRDFDWNKYMYGNNLGLGMYQAELDNYNDQMKSFYDMLSGVANVGINASNRAGDLSADSSTALANLFMAMAQMQSMAGVAGAQQQGDFMSSLFSLIPTLLGGGK